MIETKAPILPNTERVMKPDLVRISFMINKRTLDKVTRVQLTRNLNTRTAAIIEIINAFQE
jgi:hypothetical protein